jgi:hypothetical protein
MTKKNNRLLSYLLIAAGILVMLFSGVSAYIPPLSEVNIGGENGITVAGIPAFSAIFLFVGAVVFFSGLGVFLKSR